MPRNPSGQAGLNSFAAQGTTQVWVRASHSPLAQGDGNCAGEHSAPAGKRAWHVPASPQNEPEPHATVAHESPTDGRDTQTPSAQ
jgi:hypothetical protein